MKKSCENCIRSEDKTYIEFPCSEHEGKICLYCGFEKCSAGEEMAELLRSFNEKEENKAKGS